MLKSRFLVSVCLCLGIAGGYSAGADEADIPESLPEGPIDIRAPRLMFTNQTVIASGGVRTGLDIARALAVGATAGGFAAPVLRAHRDGGFDGALELLSRTIHALRAVLLLCGCRKPAELASAPHHLGPELRAWFDDFGLR